MSNELFNAYPKADQLLEKWDTNISAVNEALGQELSLDRKIVLASTLQNTQDGINRALLETTQASDVGPFKTFALELITAVVPNLIASDIVSVQPMSNRIGEVRYLKYLYGSNKGSVKAGTEFSSAFGLGATEPTYSSEEIDQEIIGAAGQSKYEGNFSYVPVRPGSIKITVGGVEVVDNGNGVLKGTNITGTIDYQSGAYTLDFGSAQASDDVTAQYQYQLDHAPVSVPQVDIKVETMPIIAKSRKLRALYAFDAAYDMQRDYGVDINTSLVSQIAAEIKHEIDGEILQDLVAQAGATTDPLTFSTAAPTGVSLKDHYESFYNKIIEASNAIFAATKRASATFVVVGTGAANVVESLDRFKPSGLLNPVGPHLAGTLNNTIPVYKNPYYPADTFLVGYKGQGLFDAGYVYSPYQPVMTTNLIMLDDFVGRRGFATSYGKKMVNSKLYAKGKIINN
ncbi:major capsid protein [Listeria phage LIS04]|nr:major capsid protein [Listeria phage LIS04]